MLMGAGPSGYLRGADFPPTKVPFLPLPHTPRLPDFKAGQMTAGESGTPRPLMRDSHSYTDFQGQSGSSSGRVFALYVFNAGLNRGIL